MDSLVFVNRDQLGHMLVFVMSIHHEGQEAAV